jgi:hypothetical protein
MRAGDFLRRVEAALGDGRVICERCGATLETYQDQCLPDAADPCPGFVAIERAGSASDDDRDERRAAA